MEQSKHFCAYHGEVEPPSDFIGCDSCGHQFRDVLEWRAEQIISVKSQYVISQEWSMSIISRERCPLCLEPLSTVSILPPNSGVWWA